MPTSPPLRAPSLPRGPGRPLVSLREDVDVRYVDPYRTGSPLVAYTPWGPVDLGPQDGPGRTALWRMSLGPVDAANLRPDPRPDDGLDVLFRRLADVIVHSLAPADGTGPVLSVVPLVPGARFLPVVPADGTTVQLAPEVVVRRRGADLELARPHGRYRVDLHRAPATLLPAALVGPRPTGEVAIALGDDPAGLVCEAIAHLLGAEVLE